MAYTISDHILSIKENTTMEDRYNRTRDAFWGALLAIGAALAIQSGAAFVAGQYAHLRRDSVALLEAQKKFTEQELEAVTAQNQKLQAEIRRIQEDVRALKAIPVEGGASR